MEEVQTQGTHTARSPPRGVRGWEADARSQEGSPVSPDWHDIERHISDRRRSRGDATSTPMGTARAHLEATPPERQPGQIAGPAPGAHAPHSPASASDAQPNARQRPPPAATPQGDATEVGWELHSKEHTSKRNLEMPCAFKVSMIH